MGVASMEVALMVKKRHGRFEMRSFEFEEVPPSPLLKFIFFHIGEISLA
jgi:hypothetical protein